MTRERAEEKNERRNQDQCADREPPQQKLERNVRRRRLPNGERRRNEKRVLRERPAPENEGDLRRRSHARDVVVAAPQARERDDGHDGGGEMQRRRPRRDGERAAESRRFATGEGERTERDDEDRH